MNQQEHQEVMAIFGELKVATINMRDDCRVLCHLVKRFGDLAKQHGIETAEGVQQVNGHLTTFQSYFDNMVTMLEKEPR